MLAKRVSEGLRAVLFKTRNVVVPAKAGTHTPQQKWDSWKFLLVYLSDPTPAQGLWVPAFAGATEESHVPRGFALRVGGAVAGSSGQGWRG
jgi:hypothetical protein